MTSSSDLFDLIKTMTRQEKRYFKLYATAYTGGGNNKSTQLFDAIDRQDHYNERQLINKLGKSGATGNMASAKYRLSNLILDSLAAYHKGRSVSAELRTMLARIEILYHKRLYLQCRKMIARARKKAEEYERYEFLMEIHFWERRYLLNDISKSQEKDLQRHYSSMRKTIANIENSTAYLDLLDKIQAISTRYRNLPTREDREKLQQVIADSLLRSSESANTFVAKTSRLETLGFYARLIGDFEAAFDYYRGALRLWEQRPMYIRDNLDRFKAYMTNYLDCCITLKRFEEFVNTVKKLRALPAASREAEIRFFENISYLELWYCLNNGHLDEGLRTAYEIETLLPDFGPAMRPNRVLTLLHNCAILYFLFGMFGKALEALHQILNFRAAEPRRDIQTFTQVFRLVIHYELGDYETLEHLFATTSRFLSRQTTQTAYEQGVLSTLKKLLNAPDKDHRNRILQSLRDNLLGIARDAPGAVPPGLVELLVWVESILRNRPIREVFTEKMRSGHGQDISDMFAQEE